MFLTKHMVLVLNKLIDMECASIGCKIDITDFDFNPDLLDVPLDSVVDQLELEGALCISDNRETVRLTEAGRRYKEMQRYELKEFLFKSIFTPIFVACVTSLITIVITNALSRWL